MLVDMHAHVIPDELPQGAGPAPLPYVERGEGDQRVLVGARSRFPVTEIWHSPQRRLEAMGANGVDVEVLSPMPSFLDYSFSPPDSVKLGRQVNEFVATLCGAAPGRFYGFGLVPMQDPELAAKELSNVVALGLRGIEISSNVNGVAIGDERFFDFFSEVERLNLAVFVHALNPTMQDRMPRSTAPSYALGAEQTVAVASATSGGIAERCPNLRLAFSHGGGGFAALIPRAHYFWAKRWNEEPPGELPLDAEGRPIPAPFERARHFYYDALLFDRRVLRMAIDVLGEDRLLIGTDFPAMERERPVGHSLFTMGLSPETLEKITWRNCGEFLGINLVSPAAK